MPPCWVGYSFRHGDRLPPQQRADLADGRVLRVDAGSRSVLWPYDSAGAPISGVRSVVAGARGLAPAELVELLLVTFEDLGVQLRVPADIACEIGFITSAERDDLMSDASRQTQREIADVLRRAQRLPESVQEALATAADDHTHFARLARRARLRCHLIRPTWTWSLKSIAQLLQEGGATSAQLQYLAGATFDARRYALERSMERAWNEAFWLGRAIPNDDV